jgi:hypothetical protein
MPRNPAIPKLAVAVISMVPKSKLRAFKLFAYSFDRTLRTRLVGMGHHHQKFFSSQSSTHIRLACLRRQNVRECLECGVPGVVPVGVVDLLEKIQVGAITAQKGKSHTCYFAAGDGWLRSRRAPGPMDCHPPVPREKAIHSVGDRPNPRGEVNSDPPPLYTKP